MAPGSHVNVSSPTRWARFKNIASLKKYRNHAIVANTSTATQVYRAARTSLGELFRGRIEITPGPGIEEEQGLALAAAGNSEIGPRIEGLMFAEAKGLSGSSADPAPDSKNYEYEVSGLLTDFKNTCISNKRIKAKIRFVMRCIFPVGTILSAWFFGGMKRREVAAVDAITKNFGNRAFEEELGRQFYKLGLGEREKKRFFKLIRPKTEKLEDAYLLLQNFKFSRAKIPFITWLLPAVGTLIGLFIYASRKGKERKAVDSFASQLSNIAENQRTPLLKLLSRKETEILFSAVEARFRKMLDLSKFKAELAIDDWIAKRKNGETINDIVELARSRKGRSHLILTIFSKLTQENQPRLGKLITKLNRSKLEGKKLGQFILETVAIESFEPAKIRAGEKTEIKIVGTNLSTAIDSWVPYDPLNPEKSPKFEMGDPASSRRLTLSKLNIQGTYDRFVITLTIKENTPAGEKTIFFLDKSGNKVAKVKWQVLGSDGVEAAPRDKAAAPPVPASPPPVGTGRPPAFGAGRRKDDLLLTKNYEYRKIKRIGSGGFGIVHLVETATGELKAAKEISVRTMIETLEPDFDDRNKLANAIRKMIERAEQEYQIIYRKIDSPYVCKAEDSDIYRNFPDIKTPAKFRENFKLKDVEEKKITIISEFVAAEPGSTKVAPELREEIKKGGMSEKRAFDLLFPIMKVLAEGHDQGISHRDLKPSNILLPKDANGQEYAKLLDYGAAKDESRSTRITEFEAIRTPNYSPPWSYYAVDGNWDNQKDIFQKGIIIVECLTGTNPCKIMTKSELAEFQDSKRPLILGEAQIARPKLREVLQRMLSSRPEDNYESMWDAIAALKEALGRAGAPAEDVSIVIEREHKEAMDEPEKVSVIDLNLLERMLSMKVPVKFQKKDEEVNLKPLEKLLGLMNSCLPLMEKSSDEEFQDYGLKRLEAIAQLRTIRKSLAAEIKRVKAARAEGADFELREPIKSPLDKPPAAEGAKEPKKEINASSPEVATFMEDLKAAQDFSELLDEFNLMDLSVTRQDAAIIIRILSEKENEVDDDDLESQEAIIAANMYFTQKLIKKE